MSKGNGSLSEIINHMRKLLGDITTDLEKSSKGNKAASQRVRTGTVKLEKIAKSYRKESIQSEKSPSGRTKTKAATKKAAPAKKASAAKSATNANKAKSSAKAQKPTAKNSSQKPAAKSKTASKSSAPKAKSHRTSAKAFSLRKPTAKLPSRRAAH